MLDLIIVLSLLIAGAVFGGIYGFLLALLVVCFLPSFGGL